jgi:hypothetical protein
MQPTMIARHLSGYRESVLPRRKMIAAMIISGQTKAPNVTTFGDLTLFINPAMYHPNPYRNPSGMFVRFGSPSANGNNMPTKPEAKAYAKAII